MPSLWSAVAVSTARGSAALLASVSVIAFALLPLPSLQAEPRNQNCRQQERYHRRRDRGAFPELAGNNRALVGQGCHQLRCVDGSATRQHPDQLEVGEGEQ